MVDPPIIQGLSTTAQTAIAGGAGIVLSSATRAITEPIVRRLLRRAGSLSEGIKEDFKIQGQEVSIICPRGIQEIDLFFNIEKNLSSSRKRFQGNVTNVTLKSFNPYEELTSKAIVVNDNGFEIFYKHLDPNRTYWLKTDYYIENTDRLVNDWVYTKVAHESPKGEDEIYWLEAQFRAFEQFRRIFDKFELVDMDFQVKVLIDNHVKTAIPRTYEEEIQTIRQWMRSKDREEKSKLSHRHIQQQQRYPNEKDATDLIRKLQELFTAHRFRQYVDLSKNFKHHDILRGSEMGSIVPYLSWPKYMNVVTRTNLNNENPAVEGRLIYKYKSFQDAITKIF